MDAAMKAVKAAAVAKAVSVGAAAATPVAASIFGGAVTASTGALGTTAAFGATATLMPVILPLAIVGGAAYGAARLTGWAFDTVFGD